MIACLFHQPALRRHLDGGEKLSARAQSHLDQCPHCRAAFAEERAVASALGAKPAAIEPPPFLRARILNAVRQSEPAPARLDWRWIAATAAVALAAAFVATRPGPTAPRSVQPFNVAFQTKIEFPVAVVENPLETEIENLQNDTRNAARALAASFMPTPGH